MAAGPNVRQKVGMGEAEKRNIAKRDSFLADLDVRRQQTRGASTRELFEFAGRELEVVAELLTMCKEAADEAIAEARNGPAKGWSKRVNAVTVYWQGQVAAQKQYVRSLLDQMSELSIFINTRAEPHSSESD